MREGEENSGREREQTERKRDADSQPARQTDRQTDREPYELLLLLFILILFSCVTLRLEDHGEKRQEVDMQR